MKRRLSLLRCSLAFSSLSFRCCVQQIVEGEHHARTVTVQRRSGRPAGIAYLLSLVFRAVQRSNAEGNDLKAFLTELPDLSSCRHFHGSCYNEDLSYAVPRRTFGRVILRDRQFPCKPSRAAVQDTRDIPANIRNAPECFLIFCIEEGHLRLRRKQHISYRRRVLKHFLCDRPNRKAGFPVPPL